MKYHDLIKFNHGTMQIDEKAVFGTVGEDTVQACNGVALQEAESSITKQKMLFFKKSVYTLELTAAEGNGLWVPYRAKQSVYSLIGGKTWAASGPYSGCYFEVGKIGGLYYAAHISKESKIDPNLGEWDNVAKTVLFRKKIGLSRSLPRGARGAAAIVFANFEGAVSVTRVDVLTQSAGQMHGPIFNVQSLDSDDTTTWG